MASIPSPIRKWIRRYITGEGSNEIANQSPVQSVNSQTGDVTISTGGGSIPPSQTVTSYSDLPTTDLSEAEIWLVAGEEDVVVSTQLSPVVWRSVSDFTKVASQIPDSAVAHGVASDYDGSKWVADIGPNLTDGSGDPSQVADVVNGEPVVRYDGATDASQTTTTLATTEPFAVVFTGAQRSTGDSNYLIDGGSKDELAIQESGSEYFLQRGGSNGGGVGSVDTDFHVFALIGQFTDDIKLIKDGNEFTAQSASSANLSGLTLGSNGALSGNEDMDFAEYTVLESYSASDLNSEINRQANKFGISTS